MSIMYRTLYEAFPNDTYLFVRRDPAEWVDSMRRFFARDWPIPLSLHSIMYGYPIKSSNFDAQACLRMYRRLCDDVLEYFHGKPNFHLIEMKDLSWRTLCSAVGRPEPSIPFPWENKALVIS